MPLTSFAGGRLFGARHGSATPWVLALHGWRRTHRDFATVLEGTDAIAIDLAGFGVAPPPPAGWTTAEYAAWVAPVLDEMAPEVVVLGHSFGGRVAVHLAASHPGRVAGLVLTGVPLTRPPGVAPARPPAGFRVGKMLHRAGLVSAARMEVLREKYGSEDYRAAQGSVREVLVKAVNEDYLETLGRYPGPVEMVWGEGDTAAPVAGAERAAASCGRCKLVILPGVDHFTPQRAPQELRQALSRLRP
jgi:pimeloyl-ACP methyl ester carboxylesterase